MLRVSFNHPVGGVPTDLVAKVRKMAVLTNESGKPVVRLDDWDVFAADGVTPVDLDAIDDPAGDELSGAAESVIEDCLATSAPLTQAA